MPENETIPEVELDTFEDAMSTIVGFANTILCNLLNIESLDTEYVEMNPTYPGAPYNPDLPPENALYPHMMVHLSHNSRMHKMYCEFTFDHDMLNYLRTTGIYTGFRNKFCKKLYNEYTDHMGLHERIFMVHPRLYCPKEYGTSDVIGINTVGFWVNLEGKEEFLLDSIETELAFTQYKMTHLDNEQAYFREIESFARKVHEFNESIESETYTKREAFEAYKEYFNDEFKDEYQEINPDTGEEETKYYYPLYDFYEKFYRIYYYDLIPEPPEEDEEEE